MKTIHQTKLAQITAYNRMNEGQRRTDRMLGPALISGIVVTLSVIAWSFLRN